MSLLTFGLSAHVDYLIERLKVADELSAVVHAVIARHGRDKHLELERVARNYDQLRSIPFDPEAV